MHHTDTVRIATNPRKWRRPAPCPACRKSRPLILTIWTELPEWVVWLLRHKTWKTMHNQQRKESK